MSNGGEWTVPSENELLLYCLFFFWRTSERFRKIKCCNVGFIKRIAPKCSLMLDATISILLYFFERESLDPNSVHALLNLQRLRWFEGWRGRCVQCPRKGTKQRRCIPLGWWPTPDSQWGAECCTLKTEETNNTLRMWKHKMVKFKINDLIMIKTEKKTT